MSVIEWDWVALDRLESVAGEIVRTKDGNGWMFYPDDGRVVEGPFERLGDAKAVGDRYMGVPCSYSGDDND